eukprot:6867884-Lingulodinium_polyedra.AAC.1
MGDALEGLVLVGQCDCRARAQIVRLGVPTEASDGFSRITQEALPQLLLHVAERGASPYTAKVLEGTPDIHMAATTLLG